MDARSPAHALPTLTRRRAFADQLGLPGLFLRAAAISLDHPLTRERITIASPASEWGPQWRAAFDAFGCCPLVGGASVLAGHGGAGGWAGAAGPDGAGVAAGGQDGHHVLWGQGAWPELAAEPLPLWGQLPVAQPAGAAGQPEVWGRTSLDPQDAL